LADRRDGAGSASTEASPGPGTERRPDVSASVRGPFPPDATKIVRSTDGTSIAVFEASPADVQATETSTTSARAARTGSGRPRTDAAPAGAGPRPPLLLVHGATADHTTFRAIAPQLLESRRVFAIDRRGRGASGDAVEYSIEREFDDVAAVAESLAESLAESSGWSGGPGVGAVDVLGHSYGGRCALGASRRTASIRRVVAYEGAPLPAGSSYRPDGLAEALRDALDRGDRDGALSGFLAGVVGMSDAELARYRADPVWPARVAAAHTILREIEAETSPSAGIEALAAVRVPVLLILGGSSRSPFAIGTHAFAERLADARVVEIAGAAHAAHHTHVPEFVAAVEAFLDA
jgi:pimeloyl-ACP methyl ester carboxylesterase